MLLESQYLWNQFDKAWKRYSNIKKNGGKNGYKEYFNGKTDDNVESSSNAALGVVIFVLFLMIVLFALWITALVLWIICLSKGQSKNLGLDIVLGLFLIVFFPGLSWIWLILYGTKLTCANR